MPQIAFFDFVVNYLHNPNRTILQTAIFDTYYKENWYFDKLKELGLTNLVSDGQYHRTTLLHPDDDFYINDMGFAWKHDPPLIFLPSRYMNALGHKDPEYVIELGGDTVQTISEADNFGFAKPITQQNNSSYWVMKQGTKPVGMKSTGSSCIFTLNATSIVGQPRPIYNVEPRRDLLHSEVEPDSPPTSFVQEVTADDLGNNCITWFLPGLINRMVVKLFSASMDCSKRKGVFLILLIPKHGYKIRLILRAPIEDILLFKTS